MMTTADPAETSTARDGMALNVGAAHFTCLGTAMIHRANRVRRSSRRLQVAGIKRRADRRFGVSAAPKEDTISTNGSAARRSAASRRSNHLHRPCEKVGGHPMCFAVVAPGD
jgi:hypothetical protein